jgi:prolyl-tRNA synthetase
VAPFAVHVVRLGEDERVVSSADALCQTLESSGVSVLYDDRAVRPGEKFADSDLIGIPIRVVVSEKTVEAGTYEVVVRATGDVRHQTEEELLAEVA